MDKRNVGYRHNAGNSLDFERFTIGKRCPKDKVADQFSNHEMNQIKHYGQMLGGGVTPFDEAVE